LLRRPSFCCRNDVCRHGWCVLATPSDPRCAREHGRSADERAAEDSPRRSGRLRIRCVVPLVSGRPVAGTTDRTRRTLRSPVGVGDGPPPRGARTRCRSRCRLDPTGSHAGRATARQGDLCTPAVRCSRGRGRRSRPPLLVLPLGGDASDRRGARLAVGAVHLLHPARADGMTPIA